MERMGLIYVFELGLYGDGKSCIYVYRRHIILKSFLQPFTQTIRFTKSPLEKSPLTFPSIQSHEKFK